MKISDLELPAVGDIVEFETPAGDLVEGVIIGTAQDGYVYEFSAAGLNSLIENSSGYIPKNSQEAQDPRWSSALTQDVTTQTMRSQLKNFFPTLAPSDGQVQIKESSADSEGKFNEAKYRGREVKLGKPVRGGNKKSYVYVRNPESGNIIKVSFGDPNMRIRKSNPKARKSFRARHRCSTAKDRTSARYWSCRAW